MTLKIHETGHVTVKSMTDEQLCARAAMGDRAAEEALVLRYSRLVRVCSRPFFLVGGDSEDLIQEGMLGLLTAIREFKPDRGAQFRTFAELCIRRRIISAVRTAAGGRHSPLNNYVSLEPSLFLANQDFAPFGTAYPSHRDPEDVIIRQENMSALQKALRDQLTGLEAQVLDRYLDGASYAEIAEEVHRSAKSVDNAVQRIRKKIARHISRGEYSES
ncbi:MAG: sigma-70 family RNA polymerase sigma factor [Ruminiclostridium sp.]|nr:sigma-70 family RNA polymerase sigma factor [Ruminiclostridium sp.]